MSVTQGTGVLEPNVGSPRGGQAATHGRYFWKLSPFVVHKWWCRHFFLPSFLSSILPLPFFLPSCMFPSFFIPPSILYFSVFPSVPFIPLHIFGGVCMEAWTSIFPPFLINSMGIKSGRLLLSAYFKFICNFLTLHLVLLYLNSQSRAFLPLLYSSTLPQKALGDSWAATVPPTKQQARQVWSYVTVTPETAGGNERLV